MKHLVAHPSLSRKMMTEVDPARSRTIRVVRSQDTGPEVTVRRIAHKLGDRFRLHRKDLPGTPDLVFPRFRKVIFVHGCFWHGHDCPRGSREPQMNRDYWAGKLEKNKARTPRPCQIYDQWVGRRRRCGSAKSGNRRTNDFVVSCHRKCRS